MISWTHFGVTYDRENPNTPVVSRSLEFRRSFELHTETKIKSNKIIMRETWDMRDVHAGKVELKWWQVETILQGPIINSGNKKI